MRGRHPARRGHRRCGSTSRAPCTPRATSTSAARSGVDKQAPVGFRDIRLTFDLDHRRRRRPARHPGEADRAVLRRAADDPAVADDLGARERPRERRARAAPHASSARVWTCASPTRARRRCTSSPRWTACPRCAPVLTLFEGVATGAADGYARMAGRPAAVLLHLGPGLGNGLANLHNARRAGLRGRDGRRRARHRPPAVRRAAAVRHRRRRGRGVGVGAHAAPRPPTSAATPPTPWPRPARAGSRP